MDQVIKIYKEVVRLLKVDDIKSELLKHKDNLEKELIEKETKDRTKATPRITANKIMRRNGKYKIFKSAIKSGNDIIITDTFLIAKIKGGIDGVTPIEDEQVERQLEKVVNQKFDKQSLPMFVGDILKQVAVLDDEDYFDHLLNEDEYVRIRKHYLVEAIHLLDLNNADMIKFSYFGDKVENGYYNNNPICIERADGSYVYFMPINVDIKKE